MHVIVLTIKRRYSKQPSNSCMHADYMLAIGFVYGQYHGTSTLKLQFKSHVIQLVSPKA